MMSHINKGDIHAYLDGALGGYPEEAARHVREHLDTCPECAQLLEVERLLRQGASAIIAASAQDPVELDPFEELLVRAAAFDGQEQAEESERPSRARPAARNRRYMLRWAATVVVSLGAGWMARDVTGPASEVVRAGSAEPVATEIGLRRAADQERSERDNVGVLAETETLRESRAASAGDLAEAEAQPESPIAMAVGGVELGAEQRAAGFDDDAVLDQAEAVSARQRLESAVTRGLGAADAIVGAQAAEPQVRALSPSDELRRSVPAVDRRDGVSPLGNAARAPSAVASLSATSLLVPGLPVRDVRLAPGADGLAGGPGGSVAVTQELGDGRVIELQFIPLAGNDALVDEAFQERKLVLGRTQPADWAMAVRDVPGGVAVLSGPLTEPELAELLDRALGVR